MLNYVWIALLLIGIFTAAGRDVYDEATNRYANGVPVPAQFVGVQRQTSLNPQFKGIIVIPAEQFNQLYPSSSVKDDVRASALLSTLASGKQIIEVTIDEHAPSVWKEMSAAAGGKGILKAEITSYSIESNECVILFDKTSFVKIKAVTKAAIDYADVAVTISLGLIGVMALWLGIMKVGEAAGLLELLTRLMIPITRRLFPDVPSNHPAIGAMIMNIAANMLGLSNAATPLGLKAMEELNKLNPKAGTATNAMCTFLVINTSGLTLIPATAIAIRAGLGSSDPGIIIGTSMVGAACATTAGLIAVKLLQRLPRYKKELEVTDEEVKNG